jgi:phosphoenolpyruvate carboxylase
MEPLWIAKDQAKRLAELTAGTGDPEKETPLRRDVRSLGVLLGRVLVEQGGEGLLEKVEELRRLLIQQREEDPGTSAAAKDTLMDQARDVIGKMELHDAYRVTKAFAI